MKDNRNEQAALHHAFGMVVSGASRRIVLEELIGLGLSQPDAAQVLDKAERFLRNRNLGVGLFFLSISALLIVALSIGWAHDLPQVSFFKGFMGAIFSALGLKFLFARSRCAA